MRKFIYLLVSFCFLFCCLLPAEAQKRNYQTHADLVLKNGAIYTMDLCRSWAQAIAIANGRIVYVGSNQGVAPLCGQLTNIIDLEGKMVLPGFHDSHVHPVHSILEEEDCSLIGCDSKESISKVIAAYAKEHPEKNWIVGSGWELPLFAGAAPTKTELDLLVADKPAFFSSADGHSAWVNTKALELAGINKNTGNPKNGRIERNSDNEPKGTLREGAMELVSKLLPEPSDDQYREAALAAQKRLNSFGITAVQDAAVKEKLLKTYAGLDSSNLLTVRVKASLIADPEKGPEQVAEMKALRQKYTGDLLWCDSAKVFADGVIEGKTAALLEPYLNDTGKGILNFQSEQLKQLALKLEQEGFQIHVHAIGDGAVRQVLDAFAYARQKNGANALRHHIAHLELVHPQDINRFRELGVTANFQPFWAYRDKYMSELTEPIIGLERSRRLYPLGSLYKSGAMIVGGSDWSVTSLNPLDAIQVAITRCALEESENKAFLPEQKVNLPEMLAAYTINGAYLFHNERETGSLERGKSADLIVLDQNIFALPKTDIHKAKVLLTIFKGREVYRCPGF
ncbi:MAG: amidohydrolase [Candidatus Obscuribacterales bacterium]|nr:amidohydrolase [Candidatus Obscuribacterales bacterium]